MAQHPSLTQPQFEHHHNGIGIGCANPRLSWRYDANSNTLPGWRQKAYDIEVTLEGKATVFHVDDSSNILRPWPQRALRSRERAEVRVRAYGQAEEHNVLPTAWSPTAVVEVGLLDPSDWHAQFITSASRFGPAFPVQPIRFRRSFTLGSPSTMPQSIRLYITCLGVFEASINGQKVTDECMAPGWTSYRHRLNYSVIDVTQHLKPGEDNILAIEVGEGWYAGKLGFRGGTRFLYGGQDLAALCQLEVDGKPVVVTDESWVCAPSAIVSSEIYNGEVYDARLETCGWNTADTNPLGFLPVKVLDDPPQPQLISPSAPPVIVVEERQAERVFRSKTNKTIVDFGQNLVGKVLVKSVSLPRDQRLVLRHAEVMELDELGMRPLKEAKCEDTVISAGEEILNWTPKFTFHGFRYVQVDGWLGTDEELRQNFVALVIHNNLRRRGEFECSNPWVNQLHKNIVWSMRGNFLSVPTDCPQRDERLGWTGDINVFAPTACYLYDSIGFLEDWLSNLAAEQLADPSGVPRLVCPDVPLPTWPRIIPQAIWHDVTVMLPDELHRQASNLEVLERQFESMYAWLDRGVDRGPDGLWKLHRWQFGDWLDPTAPPEQPALSRTDSCMVADAYLVRTTEIFARLCELLDKADLARSYNAQAAELKSCFQDKYISPSGNLMSNTQTGIALAVCFGLYRSAAQIVTAAQQLDKLVRAANFKISTGFAGTPVILEALTAIRQPQHAYRMLLQKDCPGWLFPISMGATTVWERWDSMRADGSINPGHMTSFNHYALGSVAHWLHSRAGGISILEPGWRTFRARPVPGGNLTWAETSFDGPCGLIRLKWWLEDGEDVSEAKSFKMHLTVPPNSTAIVTLPSEWATAEGTKEAERSVGPGVHEFMCTFRADEWPPKVLLPPNLEYVPAMDQVAE